MKKPPADKRKDIRWYSEDEKIMPAAFKAEALPMPVFTPWAKESLPALPGVGRVTDRALAKADLKGRQKVAPDRPLVAVRLVNSREVVCVTKDDFALRLDRLALRPQREDEEHWLDDMSEAQCQQLAAKYADDPAHQIALPPSESLLSPPKTPEACGCDAHKLDPGASECRWLSTA